jgi:hypothetical protein
MSLNGPWCATGLISDLRDSNDRILLHQLQDRLPGLGFFDGAGLPFYDRPFPFPGTGGLRAGGVGCSG